MTHTCKKIKKQHSARRGAALAVIVLILAAINIVVIGVLVTDGNASQTNALHSQSIRAKYATESAVCAAALETINTSTIIGSNISLPNGESYIVDTITNPTSPGATTMQIAVTTTFASLSQQLSATTTNQ